MISTAIIDDQLIVCHVGHR